MIKHTKKFVWVFLGILLAVSTAYGNDIFPSAFLPEQVYTFEPVIEGAEVVHEFILKNEGAAPLEIINMKSG